MENDFSAIRSIQELKNLLDSGAITQQEFDALKRKIIFGSNQSEPSTSSVTPPNSWSIPTSNTEQVTPRAIESEPINYQAKDNLSSLNDTPPTASRNIDTIGPEGVNEGGELANTKRKDWLLTILISLGVLLLLVLIGFQLFSDNDSERLTSKSGPDNEEIIADTSAANTGLTTTESTRADRIEPVTDSASLPPAATTPVAETIPTVTETPPATVTQPTPTPAISDEDALSRIKDRLESYYDDMKASPFSAQRHFAPTVERYYTLSNTTTAAINENINTYHFPEFVDSEAAIEDNSLKLISNGADGFEVTYLEHSSALRKSKGQKQQTTARVRAKFNPDFKMTYFRQEQLLENKFIE